MSSLAARLRPIAAYGASVALDKGLSLVTIPLVAAYLTPRSYGAYDVATSLIEFSGLVMAFGIGDTLLRYASASADGVERRRCAADLLGSALLLACVLGLTLQLLAPWLASVLSIEVGLTALRVGLGGATVTALVELPLVWARLNQRAGLFLAFIAVRSAIQLMLTWLALSLGYGSEGILIANGGTVMVFAVLLTVSQIRQSGISISTESLQRIARYGLPLVGAALAMFALGSCSRWFLSGRVPTEEIGFFGLAAKLALAAPLLLQPFSLWWNARRLDALQEADGMSQIRKAWGIGLSIITISALGVALAGPMFIELALPPAYAGASRYLPLMVAVCILNELCTLSNVGSYARDHGGGVLAINICGALAAVAGYAMLTGSYGVHGAIMAMVLGQTVRLGLFLWSGHELAPVAYPYGTALLLLGTAGAAVWLAPEASHLLARLAWTAGATVVVAAVAIASGLVPLPDGLSLPHRPRLAHAADR